MFCRLGSNRAVRMRKRIQCEIVLKNKEYYLRFFCSSKAPLRSDMILFRPPMQYICLLWMWKKNIEIWRTESSLNATLSQTSGQWYASHSSGQCQHVLSCASLQTVQRFPCPASKDSNKTQCIRTSNTKTTNSYHNSYNWNERAVRTLSAILDLFDLWCVARDEPSDHLSKISAPLEPPLAFPGADLSFAIPSLGMTHNSNRNDNRSRIEI